MVIWDGDDLLNRLTTRGEVFVSMEEDGLVIFTTNENLNVLRENRHWCCDGTFDSAPEVQQLFTIQVLINSTHTVPLVYCITGRKNGQISPHSITMDFELVAINAMSAAFPNIEIAGCFFHFCQASYRQLQQMGLQHWYLLSPDNSQTIKMFRVKTFIRQTISVLILT